MIDEQKLLDKEASAAAIAEQIKSNEKHPISETLPKCAHKHWIIDTFLLGTIYIKPIHQYN